jgi:DNA-binding NarL/FixJ family response regulator
MRYSTGILSPRIKAPPKKSTINIAVVESDPLRFLGFRAILSEEDDFRIRASTVPAILSSPNDDIILMTSAGGAAFYAAMSALKAVRPTIRIIVTGASTDDEQILRAIAAGAKGYIGEDASPEEFKQAIRVVHSGSVWAPRRVLCTFIERATASPRRVLTEGQDKISEREREVLKLLVAGRSNREIGTELGIEERTVKAHIAQLLRKIGVQNRIALSVHAVTHSLLAPRP